MKGTVTAFDEEKGFGTVVGDDATTGYFFHCTRIAGGSRTIDVGTEVSFQVVAGHLGRWEAVDVTPDPQPAPPSRRR